MEIFVQEKQPEYYEIIPEFNSQGRLCNHGSGDNAKVKVPASEWERFNQMAGRQHEIIDGVVVYNPDLEPCMPDDLIADLLENAKGRLSKLINDENIDKLCGFDTPATATFGLSEKDMLINEIRILKNMLHS